MFQNGLCSFFLKNILLTKKKKSICDRIVNEVTSMYYFIGIKGSGMAPLATILYELGNEVAAWRYFPPKTFRYLCKRRVSLCPSKCLYGMPTGYYRPFSMFPAVWRYPRA